MSAGFHRWTCPACKYAEESSRDALVSRLRNAGLLKRVQTEDAGDAAYLLELARCVADRIDCPSCGTSGFQPQLADEVEEDWGDARKCESCRGVIPAERLEVFPDSRLCMACQRKVDAGGNTGVPEYCPRCGTPMQVRQARGGVARYEVICPECRR